MKRECWHCGGDHWTGDHKVFEKRVVLGLTGVAQVGKDTAAAALVALGWFRVAFADPLREMLYALNPRIDTDIRVQDAVRMVGWERAKTDPEVRALLQRLGTEAGRGVLGEDCWVDLAKRKISAYAPASVVLTDVRFANESKMIHALGGKVIRIVRPGVSAVNGHVSESGIGVMIDHTLENGGSISDLQEGIVRFVSSL